MAGYVDHGFYSFSPTFFTDYYSENYFEIKNIDMAFYLDKPIESEWKTIYSQDCRLFTDCREINSYLKTINFITDIGRCMLWCIAKRKETTNIVYPIQEIYSKRYREKEIYRDSLKKTDKNVIQMEKVIKFFKKNAYKSVTAFCAGDICGRVIDELIKNDMEDYIELIFDSDISKAGTFYRGYQIVYPTVKKLHEAVVILICSDKYEDEIFDMLLDKGLQKHMIYKITEIT